jgi:hypothetical protein
MRKEGWSLLRVVGSRKRRVGEGKRVRVDPKGWREV